MPPIAKASCEQLRLMLKDFSVTSMVRSHNHNEGITRIVMTDRTIPILMVCEKAKRDGFAALSDVMPVSVRVVLKDALKAFIEPQHRMAFEREYGQVSERDRGFLLYLLALADAATRKDASALKRAVRNYVSNPDWENVVLREIARSPLYELQKNLNQGIRRCRFVVWWAESEKRFAPGLLAQDAAGALSALVLSRLGQPGGLGVCQRAGCNRPFIRARQGTKQRYCSYRCQAAAGMARMRARKKRKSHREK